MYHPVHTGLSCPQPYLCYEGTDVGHQDAVLHGLLHVLALFPGSEAQLGSPVGTMLVGIHTCGSGDKTQALPCLQALTW